MENIENFVQNFNVIKKLQIKKNKKKQKIEVTQIDERENGVVYYKMECELKDNNKTWQLQKRFAEFEELHLKLTKQTLNLPYLPPKSLFKLQQSDLKKRKTDLQKYLRALILRPDIRSNETFTYFVQLDKYTTVQKPLSYKQLGQINNLPMNVQDIHYEDNQGVILVSIGENNLKQKITGFLNNFFGNISQKSQEVQGKVICFKSKNPYVFDFQKQWEIDLFSCPQVMAYDEKLSILAVGLYNGDIQCYRVQVEKGYQGYEDYCIIKRHTEEITGIHIDFSNAQVYSISKDKSLVITNISNSDQQFRVDEKMLENQLTALCLDSINERIFLGDSVGNIFVYSSIHPYQHIISFKSEYYSTISSIYISKQKNYILFGFKNGYIRVYELKKKGSVLKNQNYYLYKLIKIRILLLILYLLSKDLNKQIVFTFLQNIEKYILIVSIIYQYQVLLIINQFIVLMLIKNYQIK
ncbi:PX domain protein [Ichthyophthirius multifiliis]|uniref:PX domain protein n=1 Tax=Ichthyophthirius multifiliis TaxID=5932 RepID=G0QRJ5_ICHMU|nr:PX domain protein [Ichthyophthirius multifiliis]EGR32163.1 PX domain protein [Ichthyophthirius multifiliis]|eukprot:XP_004035649.1 PX domain protein [Ichthyophthirius multifiliis]